MNTTDKLTEIFQDIFDDEDIVVVPELTADQVEEWDSLSHIRLVVAVEQAFEIKFNVSEIAGLANVGEMIKLIESKTA